MQLMVKVLKADTLSLEPILTLFTDDYINDLVQDCSNCIVNMLELLQSCT